MTFFDWLNGGAYVPMKPRRICDKVGCPNVVPSNRQLCDLHRIEWRRRIDKRRGPGSKRGAGRVSRIVRAHVAARSHWLCVKCKRPGAEIDHIVPSNEGGSDQASNLQLLCSECHGAKTARENADRTRRTNKGRGTP